jgi:hypothetical protein
VPKKGKNEAARCKVAAGLTAVMFTAVVGNHAAHMVAGHPAWCDVRPKQVTYAALRYQR